MPKKFSTAVIIGRFQVVHHGHVALLRRASALADRVVIVIGSAHRPRTIRDPFTAAERTVMLQAAWRAEQLSGSLEIVALRDWMYNDQRWAAGVQSAVHDKQDSSDKRPVALVGHEKDATTWYLKMFPQWTFEPVANVSSLSATELRDYVLDTSDHGDDPQAARRGRLMLIQGSVPASTWEFLSGFISSAHFMPLAREFDFIRLYKRQFSSLRYPPTFVTVDAVVVQAGHVLLVQRDQAPGAGLWALPGGFVEPTELLIDACLRELREETRLKVPAPVLRGSVKTARAFDHPLRSLRGRTITHAFLITLADGPLPEVKGGSDARGARWIPLSIAEQMAEQMFEDHSDILEFFIGQI
jgi:bifunctional NMN adenylyltransferase/nudix hydrolase